MSFPGLSVALLVACGDGVGPSDSPADGVPPTDTDTGLGEVPCEERSVGVDAATGVAVPTVLIEGDSVAMTFGPQGGWHLWGAGLISGPISETVDDDPETPRYPVQIAVTVVAVLTGQQLTGDAAIGTIDLGQPAAGTYDAAACSGNFYGFLGRILDASSGVVPPAGRTYQDMICALEGQELEVTVAVTDLGSGASASDTVSVIAALDPVDVAYCH